MKNKIKEISNYGSFSKNRQLLMGIATILIALFHITYFSNQAMHKSEVIYRTFATLNVGVEMFLFLSGVGLYFSLVKKPNFFDYYIKRIINVYLTFLVINLPFSIFMCKNSGEFDIKDFLLRWSSLSYWIKGFPNETKPGWYVVYAMVLYLLYPLIFRFYKKLEEKKCDYEFTVFFCVIWAALIIVFEKPLGDNLFFVEIGVSRIPIFIIGCYCGRLVYNKEPFTPKTLVLVLFGIFFKALCYFTDMSLEKNRLSQCLFGFALMVIFIYVFEIIDIKPVRAFLNHMGSMSLEYYLVHNFLRIVGNKLGYHRIREYVLLLLVSYVISLVLSRLRIALIKDYSKRISPKFTKKSVKNN